MDRVGDRGGDVSLGSGAVCTFVFRKIGEFTSLVLVKGWLAPCLPPPRSPEGERSEILPRARLHVSML